jgi:hypothetical protein
MGTGAVITSRRRRTLRPGDSPVPRETGARSTFDEVVQQVVGDASSRGSRLANGVSRGNNALRGRGRFMIAPIAGAGAQHPVRL